jgi:hypothetical protein
MASAALSELLLSLLWLLLAVAVMATGESATPSNWPAVRPVE